MSDSKPYGPEDRFPTPRAPSTKVVADLDRLEATVAALRESQAREAEATDLVRLLLQRCDYFKRKYRHPQMDDVNGGVPDQAREWLKSRGGGR